MRAEPRSDIDAVAHRIIGCAIEVHRALGPGFIESVYEEALCLELTAAGVAFERQFPLPLFYREQQIGLHRLDLLVESAVVVELKAVDQLTTIHQAQLLSYLRASRLTLGLLINFNAPVLRTGIKRIVSTPS